MLQTHNKVSTHLSDISKVAETLRKSMQITYPNLHELAENLRKSREMIYPDFSYVAQNLRRTLDMTYPNFSGIAESLRISRKMNYPDLSGIAQSMMSMRNLSAPDFDRIVSIKNILSSFSSRFSDIDWTGYETTEVDLEEAEDILNSPDMEEQLNIELKSEKPIKRSVIVIAKYIYIVVSFFSGLILIADYTEEKIIPVTQKFHYYLETEFFNSE